jgi:hypothetical protein
MAEKCFAPVFRGRKGFACVFLSITYTLAIAGIMIATLFLCPLLPACRCLVSQYAYRIAHCTEGNSNPKLPI